MNPLFNTALVACLLVAGCNAQEEETTTDLDQAARSETRSSESDIKERTLGVQGGYIGEPRADGSATGKMHLSEDGSFFLVLLSPSNGDRIDIQGNWRATTSGVELISKEKTYVLPSTSPTTLQFTDPERGVEMTLTQSN